MRLLFVVVLSDKNITQQKFNRRKFLQTQISRSTVADVFSQSIIFWPWYWWYCGHGEVRERFRAQCSCVTAETIALVVTYVSWKTKILWPLIYRVWYSLIICLCMHVFKNDCRNGPAKILPVGPVTMATNWARKITLLTFQLNAPVVIRTTKAFH